MGYFKLLSKIFPASPDQYLKKSPDAQATLARMAHLNTIVNDLSDIGHYELDLGLFVQPYTLEINTNRGIIDILNLGGFEILGPFANSFTITLVNNPILKLDNRDNIYLQLTPYYSAYTSGPPPPLVTEDTFIPYVMATGFIVAPDGLNITIWNANSAPAGTNQCQGDFYLYYEIKSLV